MIVTKHPVVRSTKSKKAKSRKSLELDSDDGVELEFGDVDKTPSRKEYSRSTRRFSPLGFLMEQVVQLMEIKLLRDVTGIAATATQFCS